jgi:hypothetical protein
MAIKSNKKQENKIVMNNFHSNFEKKIIGKIRWCGITCEVLYCVKKANQPAAL